MSTVSSTETPKPKTAPFTTTVAVMAVTALTVLSQLYGVLPLFDPAAESLAVSLSSIALMQSVFGVAYAIGFIGWGVVVDRTGPKKVMLIGLVLLIPITLATGLAPTLSWVLAGRGIQGLAAASFAPAAFAYLGARMTPTRRTLSMTVLTSSFLVSAVIGPMLAQLVVRYLSWRSFFVLGAAVLVIAATAVAAVLLGDTEPAASAGNPFTPVWRMISRPKVLLLLTATSAVLGSFIALYAAIQTAKLVPSEALLLFRASAVPGLVAGPLMHRLLSRVEAPRRVVGTFVLSALAAVALGAGSGSIWIVGSMMFVLAVSISVAAPAMIETIMPLALPDRGAGTALYTFALFLGASLAPQLVSATGATIADTALVGAGTSLLCAFLVVVATKKAHRAARPYVAAGCCSPRTHC